LWQAEYWIGEARNQALALACHHRGLQTSYGRGFDDLPTEVLEPFKTTLVDELSRDRLLMVLANTIKGLLLNSQDVPKLALKLQSQLRELTAKFPISVRSGYAVQWLRSIKMRIEHLARNP
jgi:hypothetical protein